MIELLTLITPGLSSLILSILSIYYLFMLIEPNFFFGWNPLPLGHMVHMLWVEVGRVSQLVRVQGWYNRFNPFPHDPLQVNAFHTILITLGLIQYPPPGPY